MRGREFAETARRLANGQMEADRRSAISRSYYALMIECRDALYRWGFSFASRDSHREVQRRFSFPTNVDLNLISKVLDHLSRKRNSADYEMMGSRNTFSRTDALDCLTKATQGIALLDDLEADPTRLTQAIADIRAAFP